MTKIPYWKRKIMEYYAKKEIAKKYQQYQPDLIEIKERMCELIEEKPDKDQMNYVIILCAEIIGGFEEKEHHAFIMKMLKEVVDNF